MSIDFSLERWDRLRETTDRWWARELGRPLIQVAVRDRDPGRPEPELPARHFAAFYDLDVPAEAVVDRWDWDLSCLRFPGDAYPTVWLNFGAGVLATILGADLAMRPDQNTVWFHPDQETEVGDLHFEYDAGNPWLLRMKDLARAAMERWQGLVQVGMTDLGGVLDVLSTFRPAERLLLDLYDHPDDLKRLIWEIHDLWFRCFDEINAVLQPTNPGYSSWGNIFSAEPYYMLQCDFCYMIGPDMFEEFVRPELAAACKRLGRSFYHLDGPGQLSHLDLLLTIEELDGVQWIPGAGAKGITEWPEIFGRIYEAGKLMQLYGGQDVLDAIAGQIGDASGIVLTSGNYDDRDHRMEEVDRMTAKYGPENR